MKPDTLWFNRIRETFTSEVQSQYNEYAPYAISSFDKKWTGGGVDIFTDLEGRKAVADKKFRQCVDKGIEFNKGFAASLESDENLRLIAEAARSFVESVIDPQYIGDDQLGWNEKSIFAGLDVGPGSSLGATGESWIEKFAASDLTIYQNQPYLHRYFLSGISQTPLELVELERASKFGVVVVKGSKQSFAPKTANEERMIATEASLPMACQLSVHNILSSQLRRIGLNLQTQQRRNRILAKLGSVDGKTSTIDLSSASDTVFLCVINYLCANLPAFRWYLMNFRASHIIMENGEVIELPMLSTMGNGYTFAVETLVFLAIVVGVARTTGTKLCWRGPEVNCGVYGDDIIVPTTIYPQVIHALQSFGFTPNVDKCFTDTSPFRESCGGDYLHGTFVRGVYLHDLEDDASVYSAINRLAMWSSRSGISIPGTMLMLSERLNSQPLLVPLSADISSGLRVPLRALPPDWRSIPISNTIIRLLGLSPSWSGCTVYECLVPKPKRLRILQDDGELERRFKHTPSGVAQSAVSGRLRGTGSFKRNVSGTIFKKSFGATLCWDVPADDFALSLERGGTIERYLFALAPLGICGVPAGGPMNLRYLSLIDKEF